MSETNTPQSNEIKTAPIVEPAVPKVEAVPITENVAEAPADSPINPEIAKNRDKLVEQRNNRMRARSAAKILYRIAKTEALGDQEIISQLKDVTEQYGVTETNLAETLKYFELSESSFPENFPPERKAEIVCILAEPIAEGIYDAETGHALAYKVVTRKDGSKDRVADYSELHPILGVTNEFFDGIDGVQQNKTHIANHEVNGHGMNRYLGINQDQEIMARLATMTEETDGLNSRESYRGINAFEHFVAVRDREGATEDEVQQKRAWLSEELLAEKTAVYMQSNGEYGGFLNAIWEVMPEANQQALMKDKELLDDWTEENHFFFDKIHSLVIDKAEMKKKIIDATAESRAKLDSASDSDLEGDEFFGDGFIGGSLPEKQAQQEKSGEEGFLQIMASGFIGVAEGAREVAEVVPGTDTKAA